MTRKLIAITVLLCFIVASLALAAQAGNHDCCEPHRQMLCNDCAIITRQYDTNTEGISFSLADLYATQGNSCYPAAAWYVQTPIVLKIRMNN